MGPVAAAGRALGAVAALSLVLSCSSPAAAETGYDLWLRYLPVEDAAARAA
jgi:hypothetical protein